MGCGVSQTAHETSHSHVTLTRSSAKQKLEPLAGVELEPGRADSRLIRLICWTERKRLFFQNV